MSCDFTELFMLAVYAGCLPRPSCSVQVRIQKVCILASNSILREVTYFWFATTIVVGVLFHALVLLQLLRNVTSDLVISNVYTPD